MSELVPVYIDDVGGPLDVEAYAFPAGLNILVPGEVCYVPVETVAAWDAARASWEAAQVEMRQLLEQRRKRAKAEVLAFGRAQDAKRIERREQAKADRRARAVRDVQEAEGWEPDRG